MRKPIWHPEIPNTIFGVVVTFGRRSKLGHGAHVVLFGRSQPIESHAEKARVKFAQRVNLSTLRVTGFDWRGVGGVPTVVAYFLQEVVLHKSAGFLQ